MAGLSPALLFLLFSPVFPPPLGIPDSQQHSRVRGENGQAVALCHRAVRSKVKTQPLKGLREQRILEGSLSRGNFGKRQSTDFFKGSRAPLSSQESGVLRFLPFPRCYTRKTPGKRRNLARNRAETLMLLSLKSEGESLSPGATKGTRGGRCP